MDINMANEFPCFSFASEADKFLSMFKNNKDVVFQLRNRHIYKVKFMELISSGGLGIEEDGNFFVFLNDLLTEEEMANSLGHELGHTFHFDLSGNSLKLFSSDFLECKFSWNDSFMINIIAKL